jgi:ATP-dependent DNA ligase
METEPHPMDYNQFEGVIPEGAYGGGTVMIWDKGVWAPIAEGRLGDEADADRQLATGELKFVLLGKKLQGSWVLVRTRSGRQWLRQLRLALAADPAAPPPSALERRTAAAARQVSHAPSRPGRPRRGTAASGAR